MFPFRFTVRHIPLIFSTRDFNNLKKEKALIVRTPEEVNQMVLDNCCCFFLFAFYWCTCFYLSVFRRQISLILPVICCLQGFHLLHYLACRIRYVTVFWQKVHLVILLLELLVCLCCCFSTCAVLQQIRVCTGCFFLRKKASAANGWPWAGIGSCIVIADDFIWYRSGRKWC